MLIQLREADEHRPFVTPPWAKKFDEQELEHCGLKPSRFEPLSPQTPPTLKSAVAYASRLPSLVLIQQIQVSQDLKTTLGP